MNGHVDKSRGIVIIDVGLAKIKVTETIKPFSPQDQV
jgi:hypothetical protein